MKNINEVFSDDKTTWQAVNTFSKVRNSVMIGVGNGFSLFAYDSINGGRKTYRTDKKEECLEFIDFVLGYKKMPVKKKSDSYIQGKQLSKKSE